MNGIGKKTTLEYKAPLWRVIRTILVVTAAVVSLPALYFAFVQLRKSNQVKEKIAQEKRKITRSR